MICHLVSYILDEILVGFRTCPVRFCLIVFTVCFGFRTGFMVLGNSGLVDHATMQIKL